ncbi:hypothetical protein RHMOL_Rhmol10G0048400 [Rhododendron molle]|uniref:Uncharacterized protein n=1 Tax=Rhododendron molle TaxID=49168 RepID=A0ACC0M0P8_RHOML|nr:hypothetical protein RHMOL_Rhmol10G0048400 [Rhododendron molle]
MPASAGALLSCCCSGRNSFTNAILDPYMDIGEYSRTASMRPGSIQSPNVTRTSSGMLVHDFCAPHHHYHTLTFSLKLHAPVLDEASNGEIDDDKLDENDEEDFHRRCLRRRATTTALSDANYYSFAALGEIVIANWTRGHREVKLLFFIKPKRKILEQISATNRPTTTVKFQISNEIHFQQFRVDDMSPKKKQDAMTEIDKDEYGAIDLNKFADFYHKNKSNGLEIVGLRCIYS